MCTMDTNLACNRGGVLANGAKNPVRIFLLDVTRLVMVAHRTVTFGATRLLWAEREPFASAFCHLNNTVHLFVFCANGGTIRAGTNRC